MKNLSLFTLLTISSLSAMENSLGLKLENIHAPQKLGNISLYKNNDGFKVHKKNKIISIQPVFVDKPLRKLTTEQLIGFQKHGYIDINKCSDGSYTLKAKVRGDGGGPIGATIGFWLGKTAVYVVGHGTIAVIAGTVGLVNAPAGVVVGQALESTFAAPIEAASNVVACGTAVALGTATGPA